MGGSAHGSLPLSANASNQRRQSKNSLRSVSNPSSKDKFKMYAQVVKEEISFQDKVELVQKILRENLYFSKFIHPTNLEYLATRAQIIDSQKYENNILLGNGQLPEITQEMVNTDPKLEMLFIGERSQDQNITRLLNPSEDYIYVIQGSVRTVSYTHLTLPTKRIV